MSEKQFNNPLSLSGTTELFGKDGDEFGKFNALDVPTLGVGGRLRNIVYITSTTNYEKPSWLKFAIVKGVAGGGGGGGTTTCTSTQNSVGAGGGAGGYFEKRIAASALATSETVTIGTGGNGGAAGNNAGAAGGATSFGAHCSATGGSGGGGCIAYENTNENGSSGAGGAPGAATGGDINIAGNAGSSSAIIKASTPRFGIGGASRLSAANVPVANAKGSSGLNYGGGACGARTTGGSTGQAGGNGAPGIVIIEEYE
jgi:hypothetical protein